MALCYRDMTFCESLTCVTPICPIRFTPDVQREARKWWETFGRTDPVPISISDYTLTCPQYKEIEP